MTMYIRNIGMYLAVTATVAVELRVLQLYGIPGVLLSFVIIGMYYAARTVINKYVKAAAIAIAVIAGWFLFVHWVEELKCCCTCGYRCHIISDEVLGVSISCIKQECPDYLTIIAEDLGQPCKHTYERRITHVDFWGRYIYTDSSMRGFYGMQERDKHWYEYYMNEIHPCVLKLLKEEPETAGELRRMIKKCDDYEQIEGILIRHNVHLTQHDPEGRKKNSRSGMIPYPKELYKYGDY